MLHQLPRQRPAALRRTSTATKVKQQNVAVTDVFDTLQIYLGSLYVNDFNYLGRTYRVMAQADAPFRATPTTSRSSRRATPPGRWCRSAP